MTTIPQLPSAGPITGAELTVLHQDGETVQAPVNALGFASTAAVSAETERAQGVEANLGSAVNSAAQAAANAIPVAQKGAPSGVAPLDANQKLPAANLGNASTGTVTPTGQTTSRTLADATASPLTSFPTSNLATIASDFTVAAGCNAMSVGPITVAEGATVTVPDGSTWKVF